MGTQVGKTTIGCSSDVVLLLAQADYAQAVGNFETATAILDVVYEKLVQEQLTLFSALNNETIYSSLAPADQAFTEMFVL